MTYHLAGTGWRSAIGALNRSAAFRCMTSAPASGCGQPSACRPSDPADPPLFFRLELSNFDSSGDAFMTANVGGVVEVRDARTGQINRTFTLGSELPIDSIHDVPGGRSVFVRCSTGESLVLDRKSGAILDRTHATCLGAFHTIRGDVWLETDGPRNLVLRTSLSGEAVLTLSGLAAPPEVAAVSPDGRHLAVGSLERIYCWDLERGGLPNKYDGHEADIRDLRFSPDNRTLLSRSGDVSVRFWDVATQSQMLALGPPDGTSSRWI